MVVTKNMKYFLTFFLLLALPRLGRTQQTNPQFYKEIILRHKPYTLQSLTEEIQLQSGISFSYDAEKIDPNTKIKLSKDRLTVAAALKLISKKTGISYKVISQSHIIYIPPGVKKNPKPKHKIGKQKQAAKASKDAIVKENNEQAEGKSNQTAHLVPTTTFTDSITENSITAVGDSNLVMDYYRSGSGFSGGGGGGGSNEEEIENPQKNKKSNKRNRQNWDADNTNSGDFPTGQSGTGQILTYLQNNTLLAFGISADEMYYVAPTLRAGLKYLYGTVSYNFGNINTWRYGIGTSVKINDQWRMHFNFSTGQSVSKGYDIISYDTIPSNDPIQPPVINEEHTPLLVTSKLTRYGITANWTVGNGLSVEGGLVLNSLNTKYSSNGVPVSLSEILPIGYDADEKYPAIKPPYLLGNSYTGSQTSNTKIWIGVQLSILYTLPFSGN